MSTETAQNANLSPGAQRSETNPCGLRGIEFVEFASPDPGALDRLFLSFGFSRLERHRSEDILLYRQHDIRFLLNRDPKSFAMGFAGEHGPAISSMGWRVENAQVALAEARRRGARVYEGPTPFPGVPAIYGIGDSLIHLIDGATYRENLVELSSPVITHEKGFVGIDHLTNNVYKGTMQTWSDFYKNVFGFTEVRYFDIRGAKTGLRSYALRSPDGSFCIPINEGNEDKSQIEEYLRKYRGPGIQHLAFLTHDLLASLDRLEGSGIETLDIDDEYYETVFDRVPNVTEDRERIRKHRVLVDGDEEGYLLQIFTREIVGPIFIELIQRKNHFSFGEGNFGALFRSMEKDQERRGVL
ncbi:MAG: 4-hydroxyphenylpyruvate dioxygenase [Candidatus Eisenbacteria bacterium]|nr:4-hydroxyphenylpyruvate dioxygenase [Candidatus Eisenbacteria bacterium]MCC7140975.1 4-hydroxyphenylpyruvate dioxygenase [Candidatus Eisenbacteria bacterium]